MIDFQITKEQLEHLRAAGEQTEKELDRDYVKLPAPKREGGAGIYDCLNHRRSFRQFLNIPISLEHLSQLLWCADGISDDESKYRTAPSPFAAYPMELHLITKGGFYYYNVREHALERRVKDKVIMEMAKERAILSYAAVAPIMVMISSVIDRMKKFRLPPDHGGPFLPKEWHAYASVSLILEAGHICENILLAAAGLGMCGVPVCAFDRKELRRLLPLDKEPFTITDIHYLIPVAYPNMKVAKVQLFQDRNEGRNWLIRGYPSLFFEEGEEPHV
jgi:nitroreductase